MKKIAFLFSVLLFTQAVFTQKVNNFVPDFSSPLVIPGMTLVWNDEFNIDGKPDPAGIGANGGDPGRAQFPVKYGIDYVRIYQEK